MITAKLNSGFSIELDEEVLNNVELLDALSDVQHEDILSVGRVARLFLGKDGAKKLYDHCRTPDGRVPVDEVSKAISELMNSFTAGKNSSSSPN